jgi:hypothetical protein
MRATPLMTGASGVETSISVHSGGRNTCYACNGVGSRYAGGDQPLRCTVCAGLRFSDPHTLSGERSTHQPFQHAQWRAFWILHGADR